MAQINHNPQSRRLIVSAWNPAEIDSDGAATGHVLFQFYVQDGELNCQLYNAACDLSWVCRSTSLRIAADNDGRASRRSRAGDFVHTFRDLHLYKNLSTRRGSNSPANAGHYPGSVN